MIELTVGSPSFGLSGPWSVVFGSAVAGGDPVHQRFTRSTNASPNFFLKGSKSVVRIHPRIRPSNAPTVPAANQFRGSSPQWFSLAYGGGRIRKAMVRS